MTRADTPSPPTDGRRLRSRRSRQRIIDAMIELVRAGNPVPTADEVAARAGIAMRTVFRHFDDMESLYREISQQIQTRAQSMFDAQVAGTTWRAQLDNLIDKRVALFKTLEPMKASADALRHRSAFLRADHRKFVVLGRRRLLDILPADRVRDAAAFEAIDAVSSFEFWQRLTRDQRLSARRATQVIKATIAALIAAPHAIRRA